MQPAFQAKAPHLAGDQAQAGGVLLLAVIQQHLHAHTHAHQRLAGCGLQHGVLHAGGGQLGHAVAHRTLAGQHHAGGRPHLLRVAGDDHLHGPVAHGVRHILGGYDHLLFLFGVVFFLTTFKDVAKFVTVFTVGHCITLIVATYLKITWNYYLVDAIIAASVIYKGFDNNGGFQKHFAMKSPDLLGAVFLFGLLHGFGLSTRLQQLPLGDDPVAMLGRILSFNVGVELGQIAALAVMVGLLAAWRKRPSFTRFAYAANLALIYAGVYLLFTQLHGYQHDVNPDGFRFPVQEHKHIHEDMDIKNATDPTRNTL